MITILAQAHMTDTTWTYTDDVPEETTASELVWMGLGSVAINVGFIDVESPVGFDDMTCSLVVTEDDVEIINFDYPNVPIERTDQSYCFSKNFAARAGTTVVISTSVTNAGETWTDSTTLVIDPEPVIEPEPAEEEVVE
jgi:hypothetical protein